MTALIKKYKWHSKMCHINTYMYKMYEWVRTYRGKYVFIVLYSLTTFPAYQTREQEKIIRFL